MSSTWQHSIITLSQEQLFKLITELDHAVFLDSGDFTSQETSSRQNYSVFSACPAKSNCQSLQDLSQAIPKHLLHLPFVCGEIGFLSYEAGNHSILKEAKANTFDFPNAYSGYYTWSYVFDHNVGKGYLTFSPRCNDSLRNRVLNIINESTPSLYIEDAAPQINKLKWRKSQSNNQYTNQFNRVKDYIYAGDCYQINLTQRFETQFTQNLPALYFYLRSRTNTSYACYFSLNGEQAILSYSPEQFISIRNRMITTRPIKGTLANTETQDTTLLKESEKNRAENLMIVDLLRNDLSQVSKPHSVQTTELFKLETYKNVHHLVSTVIGELEDGITEKEAFLSCFPGGSITGAPKKRAMEIIKELETHSRSAYCGSVYYLNDNGNFDSNILIRTVVRSEDKLYCWGGGGIVADSNESEEYEESITKVRNLFDELEDEPSN